MIHLKPTHYRYGSQIILISNLRKFHSALYCSCHSTYSANLTA